MRNAADAYCCLVNISQTGRNGTFSANAGDFFMARGRALKRYVSLVFQTADALGDLNFKKYRILYKRFFL